LLTSVLVAQQSSRFAEIVGQVQAPLQFILAIIVNIALSRILAPRLGHGGLALSISITSTLRMLAMLGILARSSGGIGKSLVASLPRMLAAVTIMTLVAVGAESMLQRITDPANGRTIWSYGVFLVFLTGSGVIYLMAAYVLRVPELFQLLEVVQRRFGRRG